MRRLSLCGAALVLTLFVACHSSKNNAPSDPAATSADSSTTVKDTTLYGKVVDDFGMSSFAVQLASGEECELLRSHQDGGEARIDGDVRVGDEFALTTTDAGEALDRAINITEVKALAKDFKIVNAKLLLNVTEQPDTVEIVALNADSLVAKGKVKTYRFGKSK